MKLTGPIRIGIVAYAVWLLLVGWFAYSPISAAVEQNAEVQSRIDGCLAGRTDFAAEADCGGVWIVGSQGPYEAIPIIPYALAAIAPPILLLLGWMTFGWIRRGFERDRSSN